ncbi:MAG: TonB-dependent receptor [Pseudomonadota bacterium]
MSKLIPYACLALFGAHLPASAQDAAAADQAPAVAPAQSAAPARAIPQVTISGGRADDMTERRNSTAGKQVYGREELDRNGDTSLGDVLKRLPGVTIGGRAGRGGDVRMRGLGSGYTQVLLNGERPPAGFSMESLSPDQVERVEVMRGPIAEHSTRAIAGTINIVLRDGYQQRDIQLKVSDSIEQGRHSPNVSVTMPGKIGALTYSFSGSIGEHRQHDQTQTVNQDLRDDGVVTKQQLIQNSSAGTSQNLHLTPRLSYKFDNGDTLNFQPFVMASRGDNTSHSVLEQSIGDIAPEYHVEDGATHSSSTFVRGFGNWIHRLGGPAKLDVKFGFGMGRRDSDALRYQYDTAGNPPNRITDTDATRDRSANTGGKYTSPLGQGHMLAAGWDLEGTHRVQTRTSLEQPKADQPAHPRFPESGDDLSADTRRVAVFAQDEWDITPQWAAYVGARWEGIRTTSDRPTGTISNTSSVFSPLLHGVWRIPGFTKDQVRMSLTKSYKSPNVQDLIAVPALSRLNSATSPDRTGNPNLKPELATGLDLAYEHYLGRSGILSASAFVRDIDNLIRRQLSQPGPPDARCAAAPESRCWVSTPTNIGHARTSGIELEAKFQLVELFEDAPAIDFRSNYSHFWSRVDGISGPDNRLDQQPKQTANIGLDYRMKALPLTLGGSFNWTPPIRVMTSESVTAQTVQRQVVETSRKRVLDMYALWKMTPQTQLRISASNLLADDASGDNLVYTSKPPELGLAQMSSSLNPTYTVWSVRLETKF